MELHAAFVRSPRGAVKVARTVVAVTVLLCFAASRAPGACTALAAFEAAFTGLFLLLYLLRLDKGLPWLCWPLADVFNSVIAALFLLVVCLFAVIVQTNHGTVAGGVIGLILLVLCVVDAVLLFKKISFNRPRGSDTTTK
ncbi:chemokine-like factor [Phaenicophaeus curvirostris]|uniref:chemokine-like factor n=1 Tax=Phaenicophaeus curvirostris TaxID=33595 RepID=UPI0037F0FEB8